MADLTYISVVSPSETALKKLSGADIAVYGCKKRGAEFIFGVKDKDIQKVFAIFKKPCYNIRTEKKSVRGRFLSALALRAGAAFGALAFAVAAYAAGFFVLRIEVTGSGDYLAPLVKEIVEAEGAGIGKPFSALNAPVAAGRILSLPGVVFCDLKKQGSVLVVDVEAESGAESGAVMGPLKADRSGVVSNIVAICGVPAVAAGTAVKKGDILIEAKCAVGEDFMPCLAVGYAELECSQKAEYFVEDDSEESIKRAYASLLLGDDGIIEARHSLREAEGGFSVVMEIKYLHRISINLT